MKPYTKDFYSSLQRGSRGSADVIVPLILELIRPRSVIDVGCGTGDWLASFQAHGIDDLLGIDGDWVDRALLQVPADRFRSVDLREALQIAGSFDLVVSLEVGEHLPDECAATFVRSLTGLGPVVLFSAAIPFQGGTAHLNEQWPEYWADHFAKSRYIAVDYVRRRVWNNPAVEFWYAQNTFIYVRQDRLQSFPALEKEYRENSKVPLAMVHPELYRWRVEELRKARGDSGIGEGSARR